MNWTKFVWSDPTTHPPMKEEVLWANKHPASPLSYMRRFGMLIPVYEDKVCIFFNGEDYIEESFYRGKDLIYWMKLTDPKE